MSPKKKHNKTVNHTCLYDWAHLHVTEKLNHIVVRDGVNPPQMYRARYNDFHAPVEKKCLYLAPIVVLNEPNIHRSALVDIDVESNGDIWFRIGRKRMTFVKVGHYVNFSFYVAHNFMPLATQSETLSMIVDKVSNENPALNNEQIMNLVNEIYDGIYKKK